MSDSSRTSLERRLKDAFDRQVWPQFLLTDYRSIRKAKKPSWGNLTEFQEAVWATKKFLIGQNKTHKPIRKHLLRWWQEKHYPEPLGESRLYYGTTWLIRLVRQFLLQHIDPMDGMIQFTQTRTDDTWM